MRFADQTSAARRDIRPLMHISRDAGNRPLRLAMMFRLISVGRQAGWKMMAGDLRRAAVNLMAAFFGVKVKNIG